MKLKAMIKFFRKIRQNLLNEGKTTRYFKYAVGEIVLVVIGILIALQINDWNQHRLDRKTENKYLQSIISEIQSNIQINEKLVWSRMGKKITGLKLAKAYAENPENPENPEEVENPLEFINAVAYAGVFSGGYDMGDTYVYDELVSTGNMKMFSDDKIKSAIKNYYATLVAQKERVKVHASNFLNFINSTRPYDKDHPNEISEYDQAEAMKAFKTAEFRKTVDTELTYAYILKDFLTKQKKRGKELIELIDAKLNHD